MGEIENDLSKNYGVPLYGALWVPPNAVRSAASKEGDDDDDGSPSAHNYSYLLFAGGGGEGRTGIPNALLLARYDFHSLSDQPVARLETGADLPYRMAVHPGGDGIICSLPKSCRWFDWDEGHNLGLRLSDRVLYQLKDVGQQLALTFNNEGSVLAVGGEDGKLRVFKWPSMDIILNEAHAHVSEAHAHASEAHAHASEAHAHVSVKDLDFSPDGKFLVSVGSGGPGRVWDVTSSTAVASLSKENDEVFSFCRFSQYNDNNQVLYIFAMRGQGGSIVKWDTASWNRVSSKHIVRDPVSAFNVSANGKLLALGTIQGDILIVNSANMRVQNLVRKAHLGLVTALKFSHDSRALVSASLDSSARVTPIKDEKKSGSSLWIIILLILVAIAIYYVKDEGIVP